MHRDDVNPDILERLFDTLAIFTPLAHAALLTLETRTGYIPQPVLIESRDILWHLSKHLSGGLSEGDQFQNLTNIEDHLRKLIIEPYQIALDNELSTIYDRYTKYKKIKYKLEGVLFLGEEQKSKHERIKYLIRRAEIDFREARKIKGNGIYREEFSIALNTFEESLDALTNEVPSLIDAINKSYMTRVLVFIPIYITFLTFLPAILNHLFYLLIMLWKH